MIDLALDSTDNLTLDANQELSLVTEGSEVAQAVKIALRAWRGEYFLDLGFGVNYLGKIFTKPFNQNEAQREIRRVLRDIEGVRSVKDIAITYDFDTRQLACTIDIYTTYGLETVQI